jgi:hypothetical protein
MRLIDADNIDWDKAEDINGNPVYVLDKRDIDKEPTVSKTDIIKEFLQRLEKQQQENWIDNLEYGITWNDLEKIAKEMGG